MYNVGYKYCMLCIVYISGVFNYAKHPELGQKHKI